LSECKTLTQHVIPEERQQCLKIRSKKTHIDLRFGTTHL